MRIAVVLIFCLMSVCRADDLIDVSIIMTAPADTYGAGSIEGIFRSALDSIRVQPESLKAERIASYSDYVTMRRMIEDPQGFLKINSEPVVYYVDSEQEDSGTKSFVVHESDPAKPVTGIAVMVNDGGKETVTQWPLEAGETKSVFRVKSADSGDFVFSPDPTLDIKSYQLLYGSNDTTTEWMAWPGRRARFSVEIRGFPGAPESFAALKSDLENRRNKIEFTGVSSSVLSLADANPKIGAVGEPIRLSNGVLRCTSPDQGADRAWYLLAVTPAQKDGVLKWIKDNIAADKLDEFRLAAALAAGKSVADFPVMAAGTTQDLDGRTGPAWFELQKKDDGFELTLDVVNENDWRKRFAQPGNAMPLPGIAIALFEKNGELIRFSKGEFWLTEELVNWNGGTGD